MITISEMSARLRRPYMYKEPYHYAGYNDPYLLKVVGKVERSYYDVHGGFEYDVRCLISVFPYLVQLWLWDKLPTIQEHNAEFIFHWINTAHVYLWGDLCP